MLRISKRAGYGIIAVQYMASASKQLVSVKEIADSMGLSFGFLSKILQSLLKKGIVKSQKGSKGGYKLARHPKDISVFDIIDSLDDKNYLVECLEDDNKCDMSSVCTIKDPLSILQDKINKLFIETSINEIASKQYVIHNIEIKHQ